MIVKENESYLTYIFSLIKSTNYLKLQNLKLDNLLHFHRVAMLKGLSHASDSLGISPPAVTHSLKKLEDSLGVTLCHRGKGGFKLTEAGDRLFARTQLIFSSIESFIHELGDPESYSGIVSIAMIDNFDNARVQSSLNTIVKKYPAIKLAVTVANTEEIVSGIKRAEFDLGFGIFHARSERLDYIQVGESTLRYFISERHPLWKKSHIETDDLKGHRVVWLENKRRNLAELDAEIFISHKGYKMNVMGYANHLDAALTILNSGFAIVPLPPSYIAKLQNQEGIREIRIKSRAPVFTEEAVFDPRRTPSPPIASFLQILKNKSSV